MDYPKMIKWVNNLLDHYDTSPFAMCEEEYHPLDSMVGEIAEPKLTQEEWREIDLLMDRNFGSGEWAGDNWQTYVHQWEDDPDLNNFTVKTHVESALELVLDSLEGAHTYQQEQENNR